MFKPKNPEHSRVVIVLIKRRCKKVVVQQLNEAPDWWCAS